MVALSVSISTNTSPALNVSPSFFFQLAIPPSVMVGDMAGIANFVKASRRLDACRAIRQLCFNPFSLTLRSPTTPSTSSLHPPPHHPARSRVGRIDSPLLATLTPPTLLAAWANDIIFASCLLLMCKASTISTPPAPAEKRINRLNGEPFPLPRAADSSVPPAKPVNRRASYPHQPFHTPNASLHYPTAAGES